jgi:hypothetical protein
MGQDAKGGWVKCQSYNLYGKIKTIYVGSFLPGSSPCLRVSVVKGFAEEINHRDTETQRNDL